MVFLRSPMWLRLLFAYSSQLVYDMQCLCRKLFCKTDHNYFRKTGGKMETYLQLFDLQEYVNMLLSNFFHIGKLQTKVTIDDGAKVSALNDVNLLSRTDLPLGATTLCITASFNLVLLDILTESRIKSETNILYGVNLVRTICDILYLLPKYETSAPVYKSDFFSFLLQKEHVACGADKISCEE